MQYHRLPMAWAMVLGACCCATAEAAGAEDGASAPAAAWQIIFSSNRSGPWRIWSARPDGSALHQLTRAAADEHDVDPAFSPDGKWILFTSTRGGTTGVWKMSRDGAKPERICNGDQADWSPDGRAIVLRRSEQLLTRELASGREKRISPKDLPHCSGPSWSPDGRWIAFACRWDAGNALFLVAAAGGQPKTVYDKQGACKPHWSPDGKRLVYETETHLYTVDPDGKKNRPVTWFGGVQRFGRFTPDGKSILYCQGESERGPWELYTIPVQGGTPVKLTEGGSDMTPDQR
jgi:Tol biopolymer transport system component